MDDMTHKGRAFKGKGELNGNAKLTAEQVISYRQRFANGETSYLALAREAGITSTQMQFIIKRKNWTHI